MSDSEITVEQMIDCMRALRAFAALNNQPHSATMYDAILSTLRTHAELARDKACLDWLERRRIDTSQNLDGSYSWTISFRAPVDKDQGSLRTALSLAEGGTK